MKLFYNGGQRPDKNSETGIFKKRKKEFDKTNRWWYIMYRLEETNF